MPVMLHHRVRGVADDLADELEVHALGGQEGDDTVPRLMPGMLVWVDAGKTHEGVEVLGVLFAFDGGAVRVVEDEVVTRDWGCGLAVPGQECFEWWDDGDDPAGLAFWTCQGAGAHQWADVVVCWDAPDGLWAESCFPLPARVYAVTGIAAAVLLGDLLEFPVYSVCGFARIV